MRITRGHGVFGGFAWGEHALTDQAQASPWTAPEVTARFSRAAQLADQQDEERFSEAQAESVGWHSTSSNGEALVILHGSGVANIEGHPDVALKERMLAYPPSDSAQRYGQWIASP
jgi:hypothetical protein